MRAAIQVWNALCNTVYVSKLVHLLNWKVTLKCCQGETAVSEETAV